MRPFLTTALASTILIAAPAIADDDCTDMGKLGAMLGQIDAQCERYELTASGRVAMVNFAKMIAPLGGEACAEKGKVAMMQQLSELSPPLNKAAASGNQKRFNGALCDAIASYLKMLGNPLMVRAR